MEKPREGVGEGSQACSLSGAFLLDASLWAPPVAMCRAQEGACSCAFRYCCMAKSREEGPPHRVAQSQLVTGLVKHAGVRLQHVGGVGALVAQGAACVGELGCGGAACTWQVGLNEA